MAHLVETMAYAGAVPWHGLGVPVAATLTPQQMIEVAGLTWGVESQEVKLPNGKPVNEFRALVRKSPLGEIDVFGPCGPRYVPTQNQEAFEFFTEFTKAGDMQLEVAGSLKGGRYVWALAKFNNDIDVLGDITRNYILLCSPHIWGQALKIMYTPVRVVCMNTLTAALSTSGTLEKYRHLHTSAFDKHAIHAAKATLHLAEISMREHERLIKKLAGIKVDEAMQLKFFSHLFKPHLVNAKQMEQMTDQVVGHWMHVLKTAPGAKLEAANDTAWGLVNAITYGMDHLAGRYQDNRLFSAWFGPNARKKKEAVDLALKIAA